MAAALISLVSLELDIARQLNQHYLGRSFWSAYIPRTNGFSPQQLMVSRNLWQSKSNLKRFKPWADCCLVERKNNMKHPVKTINLNQMYVTATRSPGMQLCKASNKNCLCRPFPKPVESVSLHAIWHKDFCKSLVLCVMIAMWQVTPDITWPFCSSVSSALAIWEKQYFKSWSGKAFDPGNSKQFGKSEDPKEIQKMGIRRKF